MSASLPLPLPPLPLEDAVEEDDDRHGFEQPMRPTAGMRRPLGARSEATKPGKPAPTGRTQTVPAGPRTPPAAPATTAAPARPTGARMAPATPEMPGGPEPSPPAGLVAPAGAESRTTPAAAEVARSTPMGRASGPITARPAPMTPTAGATPAGPRPATTTPGSREATAIGLGTLPPGAGDPANLGEDSEGETPVVSVPTATAAATPLSPRMLAELDANAPSAAMENAVTTPRSVTPVPAVTPLARTTPVSVTISDAAGRAGESGVPEALPRDSSAPTLPPPPAHDHEAVPRSLRDPDADLTTAMVPRPKPSPRTIGLVAGGGAALLALIVFAILHRGGGPAPAAAPPSQPTRVAAAPSPPPPAPTADPVPDPERAAAAPPVDAVKPAESSRPRHTLGGKKVVLEYDPRPTSPTPPPPQAPTPSGEDPRVVGRAREAYHLGNVNLFAGNSAAAIDRYKEAIKIYPGYVAGYRGLGLGYEAAGKLDDALKAFRTYVRTVPNANDVPLIKKRIERLEAGGSRP
jgi:hypothetical protein